MSNSQFAIDSDFPLPVIPVLDLKGGIVVHAVGGRRTNYAPLRSPLVAGCEPLSVAQALAAKVGHKQLYVADLDAIDGAEPAWTIHRGLLAAGFDLWLDAGLSSVEQTMAVGTLRENGRSIHRVIAALESLPSLETLAAIVTAIGPERLVFGMDLVAGCPLTQMASLQQSPLDLVDNVVSLGVRRLIVLDLAAVGKNEGPPVVGLCREMRRRTPRAEIVAGGGVRGAMDLSQLHDAGAVAALTSTWLHESP